MSSHANNEKLLIHFFQDSLVGAAASWYTHLERTSIRSWKDLADAFLKQYSFNIDMAPDRMQLQNMTKREGESFKEYAQRWREIAAQIKPPLSGKEMVSTFIDTLQNPFYDKMIGSVSAGFADLVLIGERIEAGMRSGKIIHNYAPSSTNKKPFNGFQKKKEAEAHNVMVEPRVFQPQYRPTSFQYPPPSYQMPYPYMANTSHSSLQATQSLSTPYKPLATQPSPVSQPPLQPIQQYQPTPYAQQTQAHPQNQTPRPKKERRKFDSIPMTYAELLPQLIQGSLVVPVPLPPSQPPYPRGYDANARCEYHAGAQGHSTENCFSFKHKVQDLIDAKWLNFQEQPSVGNNPLPNHGGKSINAIDNFDDQEGLIVAMMHQDSKQVAPSMKPLTIHYTRPAIHADLGYPRPITIQVPRPFPYESSKAVPWNYGATVTRQEVEEKTLAVESQLADNVINISGIGGMTRSGRVYTPEILQKERIAQRSVEKEIEKERDEKEPGLKADEYKPQVEEKKQYKRNVSPEEACEFLKLIRQSEYKVIDQLNRMPARISLLTLLMNSESHRNVLLKILNEAHVAQDITEDSLGGIVGNIMANNYITFSDDEIPKEGTGHNRALHISVKCQNYLVAKVLVDNGSSLNVMPKSTLEKLPIDPSHMKPSTMVVRAFDGTRREVLGEIEVPIQIGPYTFVVTFQVMDIRPAYSCLLGRPWIHSAGAVPSTLHQKVKFIVEDKLIIVAGEEDMLVSKPASMPYIEAAEEALETSFQTLEIANASYIREGAAITKPHPSSASMMMARIMLGGEYNLERMSGQGKEFFTSVIDNK